MVGGSCCCEANEDSVAGDGTAVAVSRERGRARDVSGSANVRANAASDGNEDSGDVGRGGRSSAFFEGGGGGISSGSGRDKGAGGGGGG